MLGFINYRLFSTLNISYPPKLQLPADKQDSFRDMSPEDIVEEVIYQHWSQPPFHIACIKIMSHPKPALLTYSRRSYQSQVWCIFNCGLIVFVFLSISVVGLACTIRNQPSSLCIWSIWVARSVEKTVPPCYPLIRVVLFEICANQCPVGLHIWFQNNSLW